MPGRVPANVEDNLDLESLPEQFESFANALMTFLKCLNEFPEFTDEAVNTSIKSFEGDLKVYIHTFWPSASLTFSSTGHAVCKITGVSLSQSCRTQRSVVLNIFYQDSLNTLLCSVMFMTLRLKWESTSTALPGRYLCSSKLVCYAVVYPGDITLI
jgi:hypothetical protein